MDSPNIFPSCLLDQSFGMCITPQDIIMPSSYNFNPSYYRPWKWYMQNVSKDCGSKIESDENKFQVTLDVQHFKPNEITVKVVNTDIIIEGKHDERLDEHGVVSRQFMRRYPLPSDCEPQDVASHLSSDGVLMVIVKKSMKKVTNEISVPIKLCDSFSKEELQSGKVVTEITKHGSDLNKVEKCDLMGKETNNSQIMIKDEIKSSDYKCESKNKTDELLKISEKVNQSIKSSENVSSDEIIKTAIGKIGLNTITATDEALKMATAKDGKISMSLSDESYLKASEIDAKSICESISDKLMMTSDLFGKTSMAATSETSSFSSSSMCSESISNQETSSFMSSISSSLKASGEKSSEISDTISAALKDAAENM